MLVTLKEILKDAMKGRYAVGAFNTANLESVRAVLDAAEKRNEAVILQHAELHESIAPLDIIGPIMVDMAKKASVPVCVHLDHGEHLDYLIRALEMGFTSVMFDGSALSWEENTAGTKKTVETAAKYGASVEAELGRVIRTKENGGTDENDAELPPDAQYTQPEEAAAFVEETGIDALAIAFGTAHGIYKVKPVLDVSRVALIRDAIHLPLVMHGGSGISDDEFKKAITNGITKVNYFTYMSLAGGEGVRKMERQSDSPDSLRFDEMAEAARLAMQADVEHAMAVFANR